jgi:hypothetical protein
MICEFATSDYYHMSLCCRTDVCFHEAHVAFSLLWTITNARHEGFIPVHETKIPHIPR